MIDDQFEEGEQTETKPVPGLFCAVDGPTDPPAEVSEQVKKHLQHLVKKFLAKNASARRSEVKKARLQRAYLNGDQSIIWNADESRWQTFESGTSKDEDAEAYNAVIDVYCSTARALSSVFCEQIPGVKFEPSDPDAPTDQASARSAESLRKVIERDSFIEGMLSDAARYMFTDGRTSIFSRWQTSASFGYKLDADGQRQPLAREAVTAYGVLEVKTPIGVREQADFPFLNLSFEVDKTYAQSLFPHIADKLSSGADENGDYERIARQAIMSGSNLLGTSDSTDDQMTYSRTWLRPYTFRAITEESERLELQAAYPDGCLVEQIGTTFANARNECLDDHWVVFHPDSVDSQAGKSMGALIVPLQDTINELASVRQDSLATGQSVIYVNPEVLDPASITEQVSKPNMHVPAKQLEGTTLASSFFQSSPAILPNDLVGYFDALLGPILEKVSGVTAALSASATPNNTTAAGLELMRSAALGVLGGSYRALRRAYTKTIALAVKVGFKNRDSDVKTVLSNKRGKSTTLTISQEDMRGNFACYPSSDEGFPQSFSQKRSVYMSLMSAADNPQLAAILTQPKNMAMAKDLIGLSDLEIPNADVSEKVMSAIEEMLDAEPIPNIQVAEQYKAAMSQAQAAGQPPPPRPSFEQMFKCSLDNDPDFDNAPVEFQAVSDWVNSPAGQSAKKDHPQGFANVRLYGLAQKQVMLAQQQAAAQAAAPPPPAAKPPSLSANYKDLPQSAQWQALSELGFTVGPTPPASMAPAPAPAPVAQAA